MNSVRSRIALFISLLVYLWLGYFQVRADFGVLLFSFALAFYAYYLLYRESRDDTLAFFQRLGIGFRLIFLLSIPVLSDDFYRFIWDGMLMMKGLNPYLVLPADFIETQEFFNTDIPFHIYSGLNSPDYYSVYPPVEQFVFLFGGWATQQSSWLGIVVMRSFILIAEAGTIYLLPRILSKMDMNPRLSLLYTLNPLVIVELTGNLHFEAVMLFFMMLGFYFLQKNEFWKSGVFWGLAISAKLLPLIFLPVFIGKYRFKQWLTLYLVAVLTLTVTFLPFIDFRIIDNIWSSINLYFRTFEFNAGLYYLVRWSGFQWMGYNIIQTAGVVLSILALAIILSLYIFRKNRDWPSLFRSLLFAFTVYLLLSTTVHPWYLASLVLLSVFTSFRYPVLWSALIILSYAAYSTPGIVAENTFFLFIEYGLLFLMIGVELIIPGFIKKVLP